MEEFPHDALRALGTFLEVLDIVCRHRRDDLLYVPLPEVEVYVAGIVLKPAHLEISGEFLKEIEILLGNDIGDGLVDVELPVVLAHHIHLRAEPEIVPELAHEPLAYRMHGADSRTSHLGGKFCLSLLEEYGSGLFAELAGGGIGKCREYYLRRFYAIFNQCLGEMVGERICLSGSRSGVDVCDIVHCHITLSYP